MPQQNQSVNIFNGTSTVGGVFEAFSNDKVMVSIARASTYNTNPNKGKNLDSGFLASGYRITFQRNVSPRRFLNNTATFFNLGYGTGTLQLDGIVGKKSAFDDLLTGKDVDNVCDPLVITISPSFYTECVEGKAKPNTNDSLKYICTNCIAQSVILNGQVDQQGIVMNSGTLVFQIGGLKTSNEAANEGSKEVVTNGSKVIVREKTESEVVIQNNN